MEHKNESKEYKSEEKFLIPSFQQDDLVFRGIRFDVRKVKVSGRNGSVIERDVVVHPGAVIILPILDDGRIVMIRNERFAVGKNLWELPAGTLDTCESPIEVAGRELIEETGYQAKVMEPLLSFYTSPGICNEAMYAFVAKNLTFVGQDPEEAEKISVEIVDWKKVLKMIQEGIIIDGKTIASLLYFHVYCNVII